MVGLRTSEAKRLVEFAGDDLAEVSVDGAPGRILQQDAAALMRSELDPAGRKTMLGVELFGRATPAIRRAIEREAEQMSAFLGTTCSPRFRWHPPFAAPCEIHPAQCTVHASTLRDPPSTLPDP